MEPKLQLLEEMIASPLGQAIREKTKFTEENIRENREIQNFFVSLFTECAEKLKNEE